MPVINIQTGLPDDSGGEPPDNGGMEARVTKLEAATFQLQQDVAVIKSNYATRADLIGVEGALRAELHKAINEQTWKLITWTTGLGAGLVAITFYIARSVH